MNLQPLLNAVSQPTETVGRIIRHSLTLGDNQTYELFRICCAFLVTVYGIAGIRGLMLATTDKPFEYFVYAGGASALVGAVAAAYRIKEGKPPDPPQGEQK